MANSTTDTSTLNIVVGICYSSFATLFMVIYALILKVLATSEELKENSCYRMMFYLGIADLIQLGCHIISGPLTIFQTTISPWFIKIVGGAANSGWMAYIALVMALSINRAVHFVMGKPSADTIFSPRNTTIWICAAYLWAGLFYTSYLTPWVGITYWPSAYVWGYDDSSHSQLVMSIEFWSVVAQLLVTAFCYMTIIMKVNRLRTEMSTNSRATIVHELKLMAQAILISVYTTLMLIAWHTYSYFFEDSLAIYIATNAMWILNGGINPFIYLALNGTIKKKFLQMFHNTVEPSVAATGHQKVVTVRNGGE